ncbi:MAG: hypothetical protein ACRDHO_01240 [Actinomycetota bacterium]
MRLQDQETSGTRALQPRTIVIVGFVVLVAYAIGLMFSAATYDTLAAMLMGPALLFISLPALSRQANRERNRRVFWLLLIALMVKLALGATGQLYVISQAYGGVADANFYYSEGWRLAQHFRDGQFTTGFESIIGTNFIHIVTGVVLSVIGSTKTGAFMFFSWLGFWGLFLFYRAFVIAVPEGRSRTYAHLVFFLPSMVFWPSAIGKDAWMVLGLGIVAFGSARVLTGHLWRGLTFAGIGFLMTLMVRPHVGALAGVGLAAAYLVRPTRRELRELAPIVKTVSFLAVAAVALILISRTTAFLEESGIENPTDVTSSLSQVYSNTAIGGSSFTPSVVTSVKRAPGAALTVLFRPILPDATNTQEYLAAIEGTLMVLFTLARFRWIIAAVRSFRRQSFVVLALTYTGLFILAFSSFANFGLLIRERSSVLPFFLVLLSVPPTRWLLTRGEETASNSETSSGV